MNVCVLVIDTLRYDYVGFHGANEVVKTPNLDRLAAESWVFNNSFTAAYPTIPHRTDAITGRHGGPFHVWQPLAFDVPTLPEAIARMGYCTQLIHDTPHLVNGGHHFDWPFHAWTFIRGAEVDRPWITDSDDWPENWRRDPLFDGLEGDRQPPFYDSPMIASYARANAGRKRPEDWNCAKLWQAAARFLSDNARRENFFLWVDCFDPHEPWDAPPDLMCRYDTSDGYDGTIDPRQFVTRNRPDLPEAAFRRVRAAYAAKVSLVDRWFGRFWDALEQTGLKKNTAVILTADHGTNDGRDGRFGKSFPVREGEAHTPFIVYVPDGGTGRSDAIVQPQDLWATVMGIVDGPPPAGLDSHNVLAVAAGRAEPSRQVAVAGRPTSNWNQPNQPICFTVFDGEWALEVAAKTEKCRLVRMGELEDVSGDHPAVVERLRAAGVREIERRGANPAVMDWLRSGGGAPFPGEVRHYDGWPGYPAWRAYFGRLYTGQ